MVILILSRKGTEKISRTTDQFACYQICTNCSHTQNYNKPSMVTVVTTRLEKKLDENQPREQAGFRSKHSTTYHIHAINQLKEKCREYNIPLCVGFVDYEKAFDSVQSHAILTSLQTQGIEDAFIDILAYGQLSDSTSA